METLGLNITDLVILFIIGSSGIISLFRGFTKEFLSLLLWVFALFAAVGLEGFVTPKIIEIIGNPEISRVIASLLIFLIFVLVFFYLALCLFIVFFFFFFVVVFFVVFSTN